MVKNIIFNISFIVWISLLILIWILNILFCMNMIFYYLVFRLNMKTFHRFLRFPFIIKINFLYFHILNNSYIFPENCFLGVLMLFTELKQAILLIIENITIDNHVRLGWRLNCCNQAISCFVPINLSLLRKTVIFFILNFTIF
jgi:hypothetical protein